LVEQVLIGLKALFLVLLYLFIWRVVRAASRDLRTSPQESFILAPAQARGLARAADGPAPSGRLVVLESPALESGATYDTGAVAVTLGRSGDNTVSLGPDEFASSRHARVEAHRDGVWIFDLGSTNGTYVNGRPIDGRVRLNPGDVVKVGGTELRYER
jgi:pSer/pThr/pTyr-binding forkhead associated (FHA) protein